MTTPDNVIRARRKLTNKLIASHDAKRLRPFLDAEVILITGDGSLILGIEAVLAAFEAQFRDPDFVTYVRTTLDVELDLAGGRAAESGSWAATWRKTSEAQAGGRYLAVWKKALGQWVIESELYVSLI
jgi:ketosteroid isomerase-like protein